MEVPSQNRRVLLVEDSDDDAFFFERAFASAKVDADLLRFEDGKAVVDYLAQMSTDSVLPRDCLMFLDLKIPTMSGFDVLQWVRDRGLPLKIIVLSGSDLDSDIAHARRLGATDYLVKPISSGEIRKRVVPVPQP